MSVYVLRQVPSFLDHVESLGYVELQSDHEFTAFLASLTPGRVLKDRSAMFSTVERKRQRFLRAKAEVEFQVFTDRQMQIAVGVLYNNERNEK